MAKEKEVVESKYKMNLYTRNGLLRPEIHRGTLSVMSSRYGDIIRAVSLNHWSTMNSIVDSYTSLSKRFHFDIVRTPASIEKAVEEMVQAGLILKK